MPPRPPPALSLARPGIEPAPEAGPPGGAGPDRAAPGPAWQPSPCPGWLGGAGAWGGHLQTVWAARVARHHPGPDPDCRRERWSTPDGDFIDVDLVDPPAGMASAPWLVLFHGLEGSSRSPYALAFAAWARDHGWACALPHFRGCSGELNRAPRAYHSGDHEEIAWILGRLRARAGRPLAVVGVSLGGNALLRWAQEAGASGAAVAGAVAALSAPLDLGASGRAIGRGLSRLLYTRHFLATMKPKALAKLAQHPGLFDRERLLAARDLHAFDNVFTAPLHGFRDTEDYWARAAARPRLAEIRLPALLLNARNDPFVPADSLPTPAEVGPWVSLAQPATGGHVGFVRGPFPGQTHGLADEVMAWLGPRLPS